MKSYVKSDTQSNEILKSVAFFKKEQLLYSFLLRTRRISGFHCFLRWISQRISYEFRISLVPRTNVNPMLPQPNGAQNAYVWCRLRRPNGDPNGMHMGHENGHDGDRAEVRAHVRRTKKRIHTCAHESNASIVRRRIVTGYR